MGGSVLGGGMPGSAYQRAVPAARWHQRRAVFDDSAGDASLRLPHALIQVWHWHLLSSWLISAITTLLPPGPLHSLPLTLLDHSDNLKSIYPATFRQAAITLDDADRAQTTRGRITLLALFCTLASSLTSDDPWNSLLTL
jgi:hypothetical protein